jgi:hypothetical protein
VVELADPPESERICPVTGEPMRPGFQECLEVLARKPAEYYVLRYERTVWVSPAKSKPVYSAWPESVWPRARVHVGLVAHLAAQHYAWHVPFHRLEQQLAQAGLDLPRVCQVSLMRQMDRLVHFLVAAAKREVLQGSYLLLDATPIPLADPSRRGALRESTIWAYQAQHGPVFFEHQLSKSPKSPDRVLQAAGFQGRLQTDAAAGLGRIGLAGVVSLGCLAHLRRPLYKAVALGDKNAEPYLQAVDRIFRHDRLGRRFQLTPENFAQLRQKHSLPLFERLVAAAQAGRAKHLPKGPLGKGLRYVLAQEERLRRCLTLPGAQLSTNKVERAIRPLKLGCRNWMKIGHPNAGPRFANIATLVENCRQEGVDVEEYLTDILTRLPSYPRDRVAELLPGPWKRAREAARQATAAGPPTAPPS